MADSSQVGDTPRIELDCIEDVSTSTTRQIKYIKPSGVQGNWDALLTGTVMYYDAEAGDIDEDGNWCLQTYAEWGDGRIFHGEMFKYIVKSNG